MKKSRVMRFISMILIITIVTGMSDIAFSTLVDGSPENEDELLINPFAVTVDSGQFGETLFWTLDDEGGLTFTGMGEIPQEAFRNDLRIHGALISEGVTSIGAYAFAGCTNMFQLELNERSEDSLFDGLRTIGEGAFDGDNKITGTLTIPDTVTSIGQYAFRNCSLLTGNLAIPGSVATIGQQAFYYCAGLNGTLTLSDGILTIGNNAFQGCSNLTGDLIIPNSLTTLGNGAFSGCTGFNGRLQLSLNLTNVSDNAFSNCSNITGQIVIPDKVTVLYNNAFANMAKVTGLIFGEGLTAFYYSVFSGCSGVAELTFKGLTVPTLYDGNTFIYMANLRSVYVPRERYDAYAADYASRMPTGARILIAGGDGDFFVEDGVLKAYLGDGGEVVIPDGVMEIGVGAFQNNKEITKVTLNEELTTIGNYAFQGCVELVEVEYNESLATIGDYAFQGCAKLTSPDFNAGLQAIGNYAFQNCAGLNELKTGTGLKTIGAYSFTGCANLSSLTLNQGLQTIGEGAFDGANKITGTLTIPDTVTSIGQYAFRNCSLLTGNLAIPGSVATIGQQAFYYCAGLNGTLTFSDSILTIGNNAFQGCSNLTGDLIIPNSLTTLGNGAFSGCAGLNGRLQLSLNLTSVNENAFSNCSNITGQIVIPDKVTVLYNNAFANMAKVTGLIFGEGLTAFYYSVFSGCTGIEELTFTSLTVPTLYDSNTFIPMANLRNVYVPRERYDAYAAAYASRMPSGARILIVGSDGDFFIEDSVLKAYLGDGGEVVIPDGVTEIGMGAFQNNKEITKVTFSEELTAIGNYAFQGCAELIEVEYNESLATIGDYAFQGCAKLTSPDFNAGLQAIGNYAFQNCAGLNELKTGTGLKTIGAYSFTGCANLSSLTLNQGLQTIGEGAFDGDNKITGTLTIPDTVTSIGQYAFRNCSLLTGNLAIPGSVTTIGQQAFYYCAGLNGTLTLSDGILTIGNNAFQGCANLTGDLIIPNSLTTLGNGAFSGCAGLNGRLQLSLNLTSVNENAFSNCSNIAGQIVIPDKVTVLYNNAFANMTKVTGLIFGEGLTAFYYSVFSGCSGVVELTFKGLTVPTLYDGNTFIPMANLRSVYVPRERYDAYAADYASRMPTGARILIADGDGDFFVEDGVLKAYLGDGGEVVIPDGVTEIGMGAFQNNKEITKVTFSEELTAIGNYTFQGCAELVEVEYNEGLATIGDYAFQGCAKLTSPDFNAGLQAIGNYAFQNCAGLNELKTGTGLKTIGAYSFTGCANLSSLTLNQGLQTIGEGAFDGDNKITGTLTIPDTVTSIGQYAFRNCSLLTGNLTIPGSVATIGQQGFCYCAGLNGTLTLSDGILTIGNNAFQGCSNLTGDLIIPNSLTTLGNGAFSGCAGLNGRLQLSANLTSVSDNAFSNCSNITGQIVIPDKVTVLYNNAFANMAKVTGLIFGEGLTAFYYSIFSGCTGIEELTFTSLSVPTLYDGNTFIQMTNLQTIYVPAIVYSFYIEAYQSRVGPNVVFSSNTLPMSVPNLQVEKVYSKSVYLSWAKHVNPSVVKYIITRDGVAIGETGELFFTDRNLTTNQTYAYQVYGLTANNQETGRTSIQATPKAPVISSITTDNELNKIGGTQNTIYIETVNSKNYLPLGTDTVKGNLYYKEGGDEILIGQASVYTVSTSTVTYAITWDVAYLPNGDYTVVFRLTDVDGISAKKEGTVTVDHTGPAKIVNVVAIGDINGITISWSIAAELDTTHYRVYRRSELDANFSILATVSGRDTQTYTDTTVADSRLYSYYVVGLNSMGQEGPPSDIVVEMKGVDAEAPQVTSMAPANGSYINGLVSITVTAIDNVGVTKVELYTSADNGDTWDICGTKIGAPYTLQLDTTQFADGPIRIRAIAYDARKNASAPLTYLYAIDNTGPEKVIWGDPPYSSTATTITLTWLDVADDDISYFTVFRKNIDNTYTSVMNVSNTLGANILNLTPDTEYIYRVVGYDHVGNEGVPSDDLTARTARDTNPPVISAITPRPLSGETSYYSNSVAVSVTAVDEYAVRSIEIQVSTDQSNWERVYDTEYTDLQKTQTATYTIDLTAYSEGSIFVRAVAVNFAGNTSETSETAPFVQYIIDRTPPAAPTGVGAVGMISTIEVSWIQGLEEDLWNYSVYRSMSPESGFELIASSLMTLNYYDRNVEEATIYFYKISVKDFADNESSLSAVVSAQMTEDVNPPEIANFYPKPGAEIGPGNRAVSIYVTDDRSVDEIKVEYKKTGAAYSVLQVFDDINSYEQTVSVTIPLESFYHGEIISLRITATDKSGNTSEPKEIYYIADKEAPVVISPTAVYEPGGDYVTIKWTSGVEDDLASYRIYRKLFDGEYSLVGALSASAGQLDYTFNDRSISLTSEQYIYRIDAVDNSGNASGAYTNQVTTDKRDIPVAVISCDSVMEVGVQYEIDASLSTGSVGIVSYLFDFGDGTISTSGRAVHSYSETGVYIITLTVTDTEGDVGVITKEISVRNRSAIGQAEIRVVDDNGIPVPNAFVYFDLDSESQIVRATNSGGYATFDADAGKHTVGAFIPDNNWLPVKKDIVVAAGETTRTTMTLVRQAMIEGFFEIKRLSFEEIVAAGIDVTKPENQHIAKISVKLTYGMETVNFEFNYNGITGTMGEGGASGGGKEKIIIDDRELSLNVISSGPSFDYVTVAVLDIPINATFLKEFFDVNLTIINNASSEFSMINNQITLNVPDGMSIAESNISENSQNITVPEIPGQTQKKITWILRGDKPGEYPISADYIGTLAMFNEEITAKFVSASPIKVYGEEGVALILEYEDTIDDGFIYFNVGFQNSRENVGDAHVDLLSLDVPGAEPYAWKKSVAGSDEYNEKDDKWVSVGGGGLGRWDLDLLLWLGDEWVLEDEDGLEFVSLSKWEIEKWRLRENIQKPGDNTVVYPGEIYWQYYKAPIELFASYIDESLPWDSDTQAIGSTLVDYLVEYQEGSINVPVKVKSIGTKRTYYASDGFVSIVFPASDDTGSKDRNGWPSSYTDAFFRNRNTQYNHSLSKMSLGLALAGFSSNDVSAYTPPDVARQNHGGADEYPVYSEQGVAKEDAEKRARNLLQAYIDMEFGCIEFYNYGRDLDQTNPIPDEAAFAFAHKQTVIAGVETTLVSVVVRGGNYGSEWGSNFNLGDPDNPATLSSNHYGFYASAADVMTKLNEYIMEHGLTDAKFWVTSYGRGAAVANIVAKQLTDAGGDVYAYLFAGPRNTNAATGNSYQNIFNVVSPADFVANVASSSISDTGGWDYQRYGRDMLLPSMFSDSSYLEKYNVVREKLVDFPGYDPYHEIGLVYLLEALMEIYGSPSDYASTQNALAQFAALHYGDYKGNLADFATELLREAGVADLLTTSGGSIADDSSRAALAAAYAASGMAINHMPEYYVMWMTSFMSWELFKAPETFKKVSIEFAPSLALQPGESGDVDITVKTSSGDIVLQIEGGRVIKQMTVDGETVMQMIAAMYEEGLVHIYLPGDDDFVIEITPSVDVYLTYTVNEYVNRGLTGADVQANISVGAENFAAGSIPGSPNVAPSVYKLYIDEGLAPDVPDDFSVTSTDGYIDLSWSHEFTPIFDYFAIYRSDAQDSGFALISQTKSEGFRDDSSTGLQFGTTYYYYVVSVDSRGRISEPTPTLHGLIAGDTTPPVITDYYPKDGEQLYLIGELGMSIMDNFKLAGGKIEYRKQGDDEWQTITEFTTSAITDTYVYYWNVVNFSDGEYEIRFTAFDSAGNSSETESSKITIKEFIPIASGSGANSNETMGGYGPNGKSIAPIDPPAEGLLPIADAAGLMNMNRNGKYYLVNDIDLEGRSWNPIGTYNDPFTGMLDGQGFTIRNMAITTSIGSGSHQPWSQLNQKRYVYEVWNYAGLFGYAKSANIKNVVLEDVKIKLNGSWNYINVGAVCGWADGGRITNCSVSGDINVNSTSSGGYVNVGGICGFYRDAWLDHSYNTADIIATGRGVVNSGGLVGNCFAGGALTINFNEGSVNGRGGTRAASGGIVGRISVDWYVSTLSNLDMTIAFYPQYMGARIQNSFNSGSISAAAPTYAVSAGIYGTTEDNAVVRYCYNRGEIYAECPMGTSFFSNQGGKAAGIAGDVYYTGDNSNLTFTTSNCVALSGSCVVNGPGTSLAIGLASSNNLTLEGIFGVNGSNANVKVITPEEANKQETFEDIGWDFENIWKWEKIQEEATVKTVKTVRIQALQEEEEEEVVNRPVILPRPRYIMGRDNYSFANEAESFGYWEEYEIREEIFQLIYETYRSKNLYKNEGPWDGSCFGMSATDLSFFNGLDYSEYSTSNIYNISMPVNPFSKLHELIEMYQVSIYLDMILSESRHNRTNPSGKSSSITPLDKEKLQWLSDAVNDFKDGTSNGIIIGLRRMENKEVAFGHAVIPYDIVDRNNGVYDIKIYDCNYPDDDARVLRIDTSTGYWSYIVSGTITLGSNQRTDSITFRKIDTVNTAINNAKNSLSSQSGSSDISRLQAMESSQNVYAWIGVPIDSEIFRSDGTSIDEDLGEYLFVPERSILDAKPRVNGLYSLPYGTYTIVSDPNGKNEASFSGARAFFDIYTSNATATITVCAGENEFVRINSDTRSEFSLEFCVDETAENPIFMSGTVGGDFTAEAFGSGLYISGDGEILVYNGGTTRKIIIADDERVYIEYDETDEPRSNDATLKSLTVSESALDPVFSSNITNYTVTVPNSVSSINIIAVANYPGASVAGAGTKKLDVGENSFDITVKAENGVTQKIYIVTVIRDSGGNTNTTSNPQIGATDLTTPPDEEIPDTTTPLDWFNPYVDVADTDWFYEAARYVTENGLMNGTGSDEFSPNVITTRAMLVTILYRFVGEPTMSGGINRYTDVKDDEWYSNAILWATQNGIVNGYGDGSFGVHDLVTREQAVTILYRFADALGLDVSASADLSRYTDTADISDWALDAVKWAVAVEIIRGRTETTTAPKGTATRAEVAMIFKRYIEDFLFIE